MTQAPDTRPVAYLTGDYPKVSHTFILREVLAVRAAGVPVITCSIRRLPASEFKGREEQEARAETFYVIAAAKNPLRLLKAHARALVRAPGTWFSTLALAIRMRSLESSELSGGPAKLSSMYWMIRAESVTTRSPWTRVGTTQCGFNRTYQGS